MLQPKGQGAEAAAAAAAARLPARHENVGARLKSACRTAALVICHYEPDTAFNQATVAPQAKRPSGHTRPSQELAAWPPQLANAPRVRLHGRSGSRAACGAVREALRPPSYGEGPVAPYMAPGWPCEARGGAHRSSHSMAAAAGTGCTLAHPDGIPPPARHRMAPTPSRRAALALLLLALTPACTAQRNMAEARALEAAQQPHCRWAGLHPHSHEVGACLAGAG